MGAVGMSSIVRDGESTKSSDEMEASSEAEDTEAVGEVEVEEESIASGNFFLISFLI